LVKEREARRRVDTLLARLMDNTCRGVTRRGEDGEIAPGRNEERDRDRSSEGEAVVQASLEVYAMLWSFTTANFYPDPRSLWKHPMYRTGKGGLIPVFWSFVVRKMNPVF
jgi:hypothetical protein